MAMAEKVGNNGANTHSPIAPKPCRFAHSEIYISPGKVLQLVGPRINQSKFQRSDWRVRRIYESRLPLLVVYFFFERDLSASASMIRFQLTIFSFHSPSTLRKLGKCVARHERERERRRDYTQLRITSLTCRERISSTRFWSCRWCCETISPGVTENFNLCSVFQNTIF